MTDTEHRLLQAERDKTEDNTIILHDFFYKNYDLKIKYDPSDPLKPFVEFDDQIIVKKRNSIRKRKDSKL